MTPACHLAMDVSLSSSIPAVSTRAAESSQCSCSASSTPKTFEATGFLRPDTAAGRISIFAHWEFSVFCTFFVNITIYQLKNLLSRSKHVAGTVAAVLEGAGEKQQQQ